MYIRAISRQFFLSNRVHGRWCWKSLDREMVAAPSVSPFWGRLETKLRQTEVGFSRTDPLNPRPHGMIGHAVRPPRVRYKERLSTRRTNKPANCVQGGPRKLVTFVITSSSWAIFKILSLVHSVLKLNYSLACETNVNFWILTAGLFTRQCSEEYVADHYQLSFIMPKAANYIDRQSKDIHVGLCNAGRPKAKQKSEISKTTKKIMKHVEHNITALLQIYSSVCQWKKIEKFDEIMNYSLIYCFWVPGRFVPWTIFSGAATACSGLWWSRWRLTEQSQVKLEGAQRVHISAKWTCYSFYITFIL